MFFKKLREQNELLSKQNKQKALENTSLIRENEQLRWKIKKIQKLIKDFDHIRGNAFTLINEINAEVKSGFGGDEI